MAGALRFSAVLLFAVLVSCICVLPYLGEHIRDAQFEDRYVFERDGNGKLYKDRLWDAVRDPTRQRPAKLKPQRQKTIAVCVSTTSRGLVMQSTHPGKVASSTTNLVDHNNQLLTLPLFSFMLPSLVRTLEQGFEYWLYIACDDDDRYFAFDFNGTVQGQPRHAIQAWLKHNVHMPLKQRAIAVQVVWLRFENQLHKPGPIFNFVMQAAASDGADYMYRVNDDTEFIGTATHRDAAWY
jgi:hypothetical protein